MSESKFPTTKTDVAIDAAATITALVPWVGGVVTNVLSGINQQRKLNRVQEVLDKLAEQIRSVESDASKTYVKTEDFEELLEQTLRKAAEERKEEVRELYAKFLSRAIMQPGDKYDDQIAVLRSVEVMGMEHIAVLRAALREPGPEAHRKVMGSPIQTLRERTGFDDATIHRVAAELDNKGLTRFQGLHVTMTGHGSEALAHNVTALGSRVLDYVGSQ